MKFKNLADKVSARFSYGAYTAIGLIAGTQDDDQQDKENKCESSRSHNPVTMTAANCTCNWITHLCKPPALVVM